MTHGLLVLAAAFSGVFADHAVLQREKPVAVWGTTGAGERVEVRFGGQVTSATADSKGKWRVDLPPMEACATGRDLVLDAPSGGQTLHDVLVGEVWFVGGQSNAVCPLWSERGVHFRDQQGGTVVQYLDLPLVRFSNERGGWLPFTPENLADYEHAAGGDRYSLSAMAVYFARELFLALGCGVPVGIVGAYVNGTGIDAWIPPEGYATRNDLDDMRNWKKPTKWTKDCAVGPIVAPHQQPSVLFESLVRKWTPWTLRGTLWNQGDSNLVDAPRYTAKLHALWNGWAKAFENPELPFIYNEQCHRGGETFELVGRQLAFADENPHAGMVAVNDVIMGDVHGMRKEPLARRMVLQALKRAYGRTGLRAESPRPESAICTGGVVTVTFAHARSLYVYNDSQDGKDCNLELCGSDGVWKKAEILNFAGKAGGWASDGYVMEPRLVLRANGVAEPARVRYLLRPPIKGNLYNDAALPAYPFDVAVVDGGSKNAEQQQEKLSK